SRRNGARRSTPRGSRAGRATASAPGRGPCRPRGSRPSDGTAAGKRRDGGGSWTCCASAAWIAHCARPAAGPQGTMEIALPHGVKHDTERMRIICPSCSATYDVPDSLVTPGRIVRCARCGQEWSPVQAPPEPPPAPPEPPPVQEEPVSHPPEP